MYATEQPRQSKRGMIAKLGAVPRAARLAARNTLDYVGSDGKRRIRLHSTDILTFDKRGGGFTINTGGWNSVTTRARLNDFLPSGYRVWTSAGRIHLNGVPFHTRVRVTGSGVIRPDVRESTLAKMTRELDAFMAAWRERGLRSAEDSEGDPWVVPGADGKIAAHIVRDWVQTRYVFRSFYRHALRWAGLREDGVMHSLMIADQRGGKLAKRDYARIRRYARACLGLES